MSKKVLIMGLVAATYLYKGVTLKLGVPAEVESEDSEYLLGLETEDGSPMFEEAEAIDVPVAEDDPTGDAKVDKKAPPKKATAKKADAKKPAPPQGVKV